MVLFTASMQKNIDQSPPIFELFPAKAPIIGVLSIPHSGEYLPNEFLPYLSSNWDDLMQDVDWRVHELVDITNIQAAGIAVIKSNIIRTAIDLNRPKASTLLNWKKNSKEKILVTSEPSEAQAQTMLEKYYSPYFEMVTTLIYTLAERTKLPSFIDLHSMPAHAEEYHMRYNPKQDRVRPDFCLSDDSGKTCEKGFLLEIGQLLSEHYTRVYFNNPYFGGHITKFFNETITPLNNIQIEISRGLYMQEEKKELKNDGVKKLNDILTKAIITHFENYFQKYKI